jgi:D-alanyl-D-alanine carboxypeptidase
MTEKTTKKQRVTFATYPVAVFLFFAFLLGTSVFLNYVGDNFAQDEIEKNKDIQININQKDKQKQLKAILSQKNDLLTRATYQPIKKKDFINLTVENTHAGIIFDVDSGVILWEKNATDKRAIASITKLVTAMIVIDRVRDLDEVVTIPKSVLTIEGTTVGCPTSVICNSEPFHANEKVYLKDVLRSMLMFSANDAATVLAIHISGSEEEFAKLMNARMKEIGAGNTHFCRPSGLELDGNEEACYSSAYDIARVMAHLLRHDKYDVLWDIMQTKEATFKSVDGKIEHELKNTDRLVDKLPNLLGAKTGFTPRAGYCLALATTDMSGKHRIVSVVLDDYHRFDDVQEMSAWAFENYVWQ